MPAICAFLGYALFVYGVDYHYPWVAAGGCLVLGLAIGCLWGESRLTSARDDSTMAAQPTNGGTRPR